jgi:hypothetical protein
MPTLKLPFPKPATAYAEQVSILDQRGMIECGDMALIGAHRPSAALG